MSLNVIFSQAAISYPLSSICYPLSAISYPLSAIRYLLSAICYLYLLSAIYYLLSGRVGGRTHLYNYYLWHIYGGKQTFWWISLCLSLYLTNASPRGAFAPKKCIIASSWRGVEMDICLWMVICTAKLVIFVRLKSYITGISFSSLISQL